MSVPINPADVQALKAKLSDRLWRLHNLYYILNEDGVRVKFIPNESQLQFYYDMHFLSVILKARQRGFTTFIDIFILDACLFRLNTQAGIIAHTLDDAKKIFKTKIKFAYDNLPDWLKASVSIISSNASELSFSNGSSIFVGVSMRSGTLQYLHVSELGKISKKFPEKANEIKSGAFNTVHSGNHIFVESTAEGRTGLFYDLVQEARKRATSPKPLGKQEFKFLFYPWWEDKRYVADPKLIDLTADEEKYFRALADDHKIVLTAEQQAWYAFKWRQNKLGGEDNMKQEYPSTPDEAFEVQLMGAYYGNQIAKARSEGRITIVPYEPSLPVYTVWDIGNDTPASWFMQHTGMVYRFFDYYDNEGEGLSHYANMLKAKGYVYERHYLPHDIEVKDISNGEGKSRKQVLDGLGVRPIETVARISHILDGIEMVRAILPSCWFDAQKCDKGLKALENYRKEWDDKLGTYKDKPLHDWASHPADAFRQFPQGFKAQTYRYESRAPVSRR